MSSHIRGTTRGSSIRRTNGCSSIRWGVNSISRVPLELAIAVITPTPGNRLHSDSPLHAPSLCLLPLPPRACHLPRFTSGERAGVRGSYS